MEMMTWLELHSLCQSQTCSTPGHPFIVLCPLHSPFPPLLFLASLPGQVLILQGSSLPI